MASENKSKVARHVAGVILKNELASRNDEKSKELAKNWQQLEKKLKATIREQVVKTLHSKLYEVRKISARVLAAIATIDLYQNEWGKVVDILQRNILKPITQEGIESSLMSLGYLCEQCDSPLLTGQVGVILTAVFHGMKHRAMNIKLAATEALFNSLDFAEGSFQNKKHRDYIMQCILENSICQDKRVRKSALECIVQITLKYYQYIGYYFSNLTKVTLKLASQDIEEVALQAVEFWNTLSEVEADIILEENEARELNRQSQRKCFHFVKSKLGELCKLLTSKLTTQADDPEIWNMASCCGTCLSLVSHAVGDSVVKYVINFIKDNLRNKDWHKREAAILTFSAIVDGPKSDNMGKLINMAIPNMLSHVKDKVPLVRDTAVFCIGRIAEFQPKPMMKNSLENCIRALLFALEDVSFISNRSCWALVKIASHFDVEEKKEVPYTQMSKYYQTICSSLMKITLRSNKESQNYQINAYDALTALITITATQNYTYLENKVLPVLMGRLNDSMKIQTSSSGSQSSGGSQLVVRTQTNAVKERTMILQGMICGAIEAVTQKLGSNMGKVSDALMKMFLSLMQAKNSSVQEDVLMAISQLATGLGERFDRYMPFFKKFLLEGLKAQKQDNLCSAAVWCVSDLAYSLKKKLTNYADDIMRALLTNLQSTDISRNLKPIIISSFGDIAMGIGDYFKKYVENVAAILASASKANVNRNDPEMVEFLNILRENIFDAYIGILQGVKKEDYTVFNPFVKQLTEFIGMVYKDKQTDQEVILKACTVIGDLVNVYGPKVKDYIAYPFIKDLIQYCGKSKDKETKKVAQWTMKQITKKILKT